MEYSRKEYGARCLLPLKSRILSNASEDARDTRGNNEDNEGSE
jgi:hypothetical protein